MDEYYHKLKKRNLKILDNEPSMNVNYVSIITTYREVHKCQFYFQSFYCSTHKLERTNNFHIKQSPAFKIGGQLRLGAFNPSR